jgi:hypothetical protein
VLAAGRACWPRNDAPKCTAMGGGLKMSDVIL